MGSSVRFRVPVQVEFGQMVKVVGNHPALGMWDAGNGVELEWNDGHVWEKSIRMTPGEYEFKCVLVCSEGQSKWEPGPNRVIKIEEGQRAVNIGCEWWDTGINNIQLLPPFASDPQITPSSNIERIPPQSPPDDAHPSESPVLQLVAAGRSIPHADKADKGEDAFFVSGARDGAIGVADGVGGWRRDNIDPAMYAQGLMKEAKKAVEIKSKTQIEGCRWMEAAEKLYSAKESMMIAQNKNTVIGSSTCILAMLSDNVLDVANVGDSQIKIIRDRRVVFSTKVSHSVPSSPVPQAQEHEFNCPHQLTCMDYTPGDRALNADVYRFDVEEGDIVVMGSDGIFDNLWDKGLEDVVDIALMGLDRSELAAMSVANAIALAAHQNAQDAEFYSPWTDGATRAAGQTSMVDELVLEKTENPYMGGKMDDCTAVVAFIQRRNNT